jgi:uncharacterized membrane protein
MIHEYCNIVYVPCSWQYAPCAPRQRGANEHKLITKEGELAVERAVIIRHPLQWVALRMQAARNARPGARLPQTAIPAPNRISLDDLRGALREGFADFLAFRSDVIFLCILYPCAGLLLWRFASGYDLLHMAFPLAAGFALVGPLFATGLYEMSRQREQGLPVTWATSFAAFRSPAIGSVLLLGAMLLVIFAAWLLAADLIYLVTVSAENPNSFGGFVHDVLFTRRGHAMFLLGEGIGFVFAALALCISLVSFPLVLDRHVTAADAVRTSIAAARANPFETALWGLIVAVLLLAGSAPFLIGLVVVLPVLGHATWHLYRRLIPSDLAL